MKALYTLIVTTLLVGIACNQPNTGSGTIPDPPNRDSIEATPRVVETQTVLLEQFKKDNDGSYIAAKFKVVKTATTPPGGFESTKEYACYNETSKTILQVQGGCTGNLLHGKFSQYYASGDLLSESYYYYGLLDSIALQYNKAHEIVTEKMWNKGKLIE